jgi:carbon monoxide dehydrogenase subunit G
MLMRYAGEGELGGLVVGVGQRMLKGVAKHLVGRFFAALRREVDAASAAPVPAPD